MILDCILLDCIVKVKATHSTEISNIRSTLAAVAQIEFFYFLVFMTQPLLDISDMPRSRVVRLPGLADWQGCDAAVTTTLTLTLCQIFVRAGQAGSSTLSILCVAS